MDIFWRGQFCFEIKTPSASVKEKRTIIIDPISKDSGINMPDSEADIVLLTNSCESDSLNQIKGNPFIVDGPGEYDVKDIFIKAMPAVSKEFEKNNSQKITIYKVEADGLNFCHLGGFGQSELNPEQLEAISEVDVLMIPIGGGRALDSALAQKIINQIEPKIIIPMYFALPQLKEQLETIDGFLKSMGKEKTEPEPNFKARKDKLPPEMSIVVLRP